MIDYLEGLHTAEIFCLAGYILGTFGIHGDVISLGLNHGDTSIIVKISLVSSR